MATPPVPDRGHPAHSENPRAAQPQRTLLVVDDEAHVRSALTRLLRRDGYETLTAASAGEGLDLLGRYPVQVILSDQRMPGESGTEFLRRVKQLYPHTVRMILSGHAEMKSVADAISEGAVHRFFAKPWDNEDLRTHVREAFRHHSLIHHGPALADGPVQARVADEHEP